MSFSTVEPVIASHFNLWTRYTNVGQGRSQAELQTLTIAVLIQATREVVIAEARQLLGGMSDEWAKGVAAILMILSWELPLSSSVYCQ